MKTSIRKLLLGSLLVASVMSSSHAQMWNNEYKNYVDAPTPKGDRNNHLARYAAESNILKAQLTGTSVEVGFNPESSKMDLILKTIESAKKDIHIMAGEFSASTYTDALKAAMKRGVRVDVIVDADASKEQDTRAELTDLANAGAAVLVSTHQKSQTDRVIVVDFKTVALGGFDFVALKLIPTQRKVESVTVLWDAPQVAAAHLRHRDLITGGSRGNMTTVFAK